MCRTGNAGRLDQCLRHIDRFSWSNGSNQNGLAGDPTTAANGFLFFPSGLKAVSVNAANNTVEEIIHVTLTPAAGMHISSIDADFHGDESVLGNASAGYTATLDALNHGTSTHVSNTLSPADSTSQAAFNDNLSLNVPSNFGKVDLTLTASMHASSANDATALAEMKVMHFAVETAAGQVILLPAAIFTLPVGTAMVGWATRRMKLCAPERFHSQDFSDSPRVARRGAFHFDAKPFDRLEARRDHEKIFDSILTYRCCNLLRWLERSGCSAGDVLAA